MIIRIMGTGQFEVKSSLFDELNTPEQPAE